MPPTYNSIDITGAEAYRGFQLQDSQGKVRSLKDFLAVCLSLLRFTQCPCHMSHRLGAGSGTETATRERC